MFARYPSSDAFAGRARGDLPAASTKLAVVAAFVLLAGLVGSMAAVRPAGASTEGRSIRIIKYLCPDDLSYTSAAQLDLAGLSDQCGELGPGITFQLFAKGGEMRVAETTLNYFDFYLAIADFDDLDERTYFLQEVIPAGYTTPVVYCAAFYEGATSFSWEAVPMSDDGGFTLSMVGVNDVQCAWFNVASTASDFAVAGGSSGDGGTTYIVADSDADGDGGTTYVVADSDADGAGDAAQTVLVADGAPSPTPTPAPRIVPRDRD